MTRQTVLFALGLMSIPESSEISLRIYDTLGRTSATILEGKQKTGELRLEMSANQLDAGEYTAELVAGKHRVTRQLMVVK